MFEKVDIFVYSGTGNTYKTAQCIGSAAKQKGMDYDIKMIDVHAKPGEYKPEKNHLLGLMAPTIGAIQPMSFFNFVIRLPQGQGQKVFLASTGAWTKVGPLFLPGYVGFGLYLAALILLIKGYGIVGITGFGMPHNWTTLIPPYWKKLESKINREIGTSTEGFILDILSGKHVFKRIGDLVFTILIFPLPILFILLGHLFLAKTMFSGYSCNGCGLCARNCPKNAIRMYGGKNKRPYWTYHCEQCMRCVGYCPNKAVECNTFLLIAFIVLFCAIPIDMMVLNFFDTISGFSSMQGHIIIQYLMCYIILLLLGIVIYALFYSINRIPVINRLFTRLSFTHYWRKYRQADVSIEKLTVR